MTNIYGQFYAVFIPNHNIIKLCKNIISVFIEHRLLIQLKKEWKAFFFVFDKEYGIFFYEVLENKG